MTDPYAPGDHPANPGQQPPPGYGPPPGYQSAPPAGYGVQKKNGFGVAALVLGIAAIVLCWTAVGGVVLGILAIVFGILGRKRVRRGEADNGGMALAGLITGAIGLVLGLSFAALYGIVASRGDIGKLQDCQNAAQTQAQLDQCTQDFGDRLGG